MVARTQITLDPDTRRRAQKKAADLGISFAEYVRRVIRSDIEEAEQGSDVSGIFGLGDSGGTDVGRDKHRLIGEAIAARKLKRRA